MILTPSTATYLYTVMADIIIPWIIIISRIMSINSLACSQPSIQIISIAEFSLLKFINSSFRVKLGLESVRAGINYHWYIQA